MSQRLVHALLPDGRVPIHAAQLSIQQDIERIDMLFRPLDARGHEHLWEALLVNIHSVFNDGEVNVGYLEDVLWKVALEYTLSITVSGVGIGVV